MIEIKDAVKTYRMGENEVRALRGVSLSIQDGDFVAIMGPSGSGKSTLAHILGLLDVPSSGSYKLNGKEVSGLSEDELAVVRRDEIGFIFQQFNLLPRMSAIENVMLPLLYSKKEQGDQSATELIDRVGLSQRGDHRPNELSGGQQQRVAIARALVNKPRMILADEPTGNLDSVSEKEVLALLRELNAQGITIVMVTHEETIGKEAKRLIRMRDGQIVSDERREPIQTVQLQANPSSQSVQPFHLTEMLEHFRQGFKTLAVNKIRTGLSMLGILIGVAAVVAMLAVGRGAQKAIEGQLASLGSNLLNLRPGSVRVGGVAQEAGQITRLTIDDAYAIRTQVSEVRAVSPVVYGRSQAVYLNKNWNTQIQGVTYSYERMRNSAPRLGRFFTEDEDRQRAKVAVLGHTVALQLFGESNPIGQMIKLNRVNFQVIGVLPEKGASGWRNQDDVVLVPVITAMYRLLGKLYVDSIEIELKDANVTDDAEDKILNLMNQRKNVPLSQRADAFQLTNLADIQAALSQSSRTMSALLASIAAISLLVGGIGIMNIMLVSVTERTKEIGLRKAIGARKQDILLQFLAEAIVVSVVGGLIGIAIGWSASLSLSLITGWATSVSLVSVLVSFFFSGLVGIVFGIFPARKASALNPIDALRYE